MRSSPLVALVLLVACGGATPPSPTPTPSTSTSPSTSTIPEAPPVPALLLDLDTPLPAEQVRPAPGQHGWLRRDRAGLVQEIGPHNDRAFGAMSMALVERAGDDVRVVEDSVARLLIWVPASSLQRVVTTSAPVTVEGYTPGASEIDAGIRLLPGYPVQRVDGTRAFVRGQHAFDFTGSIELAATGDSYVPAPPTTPAGAIHEVTCDTPILDRPGGARLGLLGPGDRCYRQAETYVLGAAGKGFKRVMYVEPQLVVTGVVAARRVRQPDEGGIAGGVVGGVVGGALADADLARAPAGTCLFDARDGTPVGVARYEIDVPGGRTPGWHETTVATRWGTATVWVDNGSPHDAGFRPCGER